MKRDDKKGNWICPKCKKIWYWYIECGPLEPTCDDCDCPMILESKGEENES